MRRSPRSLFGVLIAAAAMLVAIPASAQAMTLSGLTAAPTNTQAGANSDFNIHIGFAGDTPKDLAISLPPGLVGDPNATPFCTVAQLNSDSCPPNTKVGTASSNVSLLGLPSPLPVTGSVYNLQPQPGEPARFGIALHALPLPPPLSGLILPPVIIQSGVQLRQTDFGLDTIVKDIPDCAVLIGGTGICVPISITAMDLSLFGVAPTGKAFLRNPTACTPHQVTFSAVPHSGSAASGAAPAFTPTGCGNLDFSPSFSATAGGPGQTASGVPTTVSTSIDQDVGEAGLIRATVKVPGDFNPNGALLGNACDQASFQAGACPPSAVVGSAVAASPLLSQPLSGPVLIVSSGGALPNLGLDLQGQLHLLLQGSVDISKTVVFDGLPDIPIAHFQLTFGSSPGFLGTTRDLCVGPPPVFHGDFQGYNGASTSVDTAATVEGCGPPVKAKCKKAKKKKKKHRAAEAKKKKKKSCKKKKRKKRR
jgi:hypothetical protein